MSRSAWAAGMLVPLAAAVAVSTAPVATAVVGAPQVPNESTVSASQRAVFPLTMTRTGGFAGFQDVLVVARDGLVSVTRRTQKQGACRLTPAAAGRVRTAAAAVPWARLAPDRGQARFPDDLVVMVRSTAGGPVRLQAPELGASGTVFQSLHSDVLSGPAASVMCKAA